MVTAGNQQPALWRRVIRKGRRILEPGQEGDGREKALLEYVLRETNPGDRDGVIEAFDDFATRRTWLMNIGPEKGAFLDEAIRRARPSRLLELGAYCGYSALLMTRAMPAGAHLWSVERSAANVRIASRIWEHAGVADQVTAVPGWLGDRGVTLRRLADEHGFAPGNLDLLFIDHEKHHYLPDLRRVLDQDWLHPGSVAVADNVKVPGAPDYLAFMRERQGASWHTVEHDTHVEYDPSDEDLVLVSTYLGAR